MGKGACFLPMERPGWLLATRRPGSRPACSPAPSSKVRCSAFPSRWGEAALVLPITFLELIALNLGAVGQTTFCVSVVWAGQHRVVSGGRGAEVFAVSWWCGTGWAGRRFPGPRGACTSMPCPACLSQHSSATHPLCSLAKGFLFFEGYFRRA